MDFKKTLSKQAKTFFRIIALATLLQGAGCKNPESKKFSDTSSQTQPAAFLKMPSLTAPEKQEMTDLMNEYASKSPSARKILSELANQGASLVFFTKDVNPTNNLYLAGRANGNTLELNRLNKEKNVSVEDTFFHEGEHLVHLNRAHKHGINALSFSSLDSAFIYVSLLEGLAYRKAALCCMEYASNGMTRAEITQKATDIFQNRFLTKTKDLEERLDYEQEALKLLNCEAKALPNQVYFKKNPDWNKLVSILSRGEVREISVLPQPTLTMLGFFLFKEIEKKPDAKKLEDFELSCVLSHKTALQSDPVAIKRAISNTLILMYGKCQKSGHPFSAGLRYSFLNLMGWPNADQTEQIMQKKITFEKVRDSNLEKFELGEFFDKVERLLLSPEIKAMNIPDTQINAKVFHFEKMLLVPSKDIKMKPAKEKVR